MAGLDNESDPPGGARDDPQSDPQCHLRCMTYAPPSLHQLRVCVYVLSDWSDWFVGCECPVLLLWMPRMNRIEVVTVSVPLLLPWLKVEPVGYRWPIGDLRQLIGLRFSQNTRAVQTRSKNLQAQQPTIGLASWSKATFARTEPEERL